jgi:hypothetical protein
MREGVTVGTVRVVDDEPELFEVRFPPDWTSASSR